MRGALKLFPIFGYGFLGVDLFFMLSGFVIAHVHARSFLENPRLRTFLRFAALRAARLYPAYVVTIGLLAALLWLSPRVDFVSLNPAHYGQKALAFQLVMLQSWGFVRHLQWNYPDWSVSAEWFAYLLFPLIVAPVQWLKERGLVCALILLTALLAAVYTGPFDGTLNHVIGIHALLRAATEFAIGCVLRRAADEISFTRSIWAALVVPAVVLALASATAVPRFWGLALALAFPPLILASALPHNRVSRLFGWRPFVAVGQASYALYLVQAPVQRAAHVLKAHYLTAGPFDAAGVILAYLLLLVLGTMLVHYGIEQPARRHLRAWIGR